MIRINLQAAERPTRKTKGPGGAPSAPGALQAYLFLALFAGGMALLCAVGYWWKSSQIKELDTQIAAAEKRQRELQAIKVQVDALEAKRNTFQQKVDLIEKLKAQQSGPVHMLDEISKALPDFVWLIAMDQTGDMIKFTGESNSLTAVADFIAALQRSGWFPQVDLTGSQENNNIVNFTLLAMFKNPEIAAREKAAAAAAAQKPTPPAASAPPGAQRKS